MKQNQTTKSILTRTLLLLMFSACSIDTPVFAQEIEANTTIGTSKVWGKVDGISIEGWYKAH